MKVFFVLALVAVWVGGISSATIPETKDLPRKELFSDEQLALIIIDVLKKAETYGIIDIATILPGLISDLKPVVMKYIAILLDGNLSINEKLNQIWDHTKDSMIPIIQVVGKTAAKEILKQVVIAAAAALG